jgi:hypothetical protein
LWPVLVVVVAAVVYVFVFPSTTAQMSRMSALVVQDTGISALKPSPTKQSPTDPAKSAFAEVKKAAAAHPAATGSYGAEWEGTKASKNVASMILFLLPTEQDAATAQSQALSQYITGSTLAQEHFSLTARFGIPGVALGTGAAYSVAKSSTTPASAAYVTIYRVGRITAVQFLQSADGAQTETDAVHLTQAEAHRLTVAGPGFTLTGTSWPLWPSVIYWILVALLAVAAYLAPWVIGRLRAARAEREEHRRLSEYRSRGAKTVRRQRAPDWAQRR